MSGAVLAARPDIAFGYTQPRLPDHPLIAVEGLPTAEITWIRQFGSSDHESAQGIAVDVEGNAYAVGSLVRVSITACSLAVDSKHKWELQDAFLRKYDANGNELWTQRIGTSSWDGATAVKVDSTGVYVTGATLGKFPGFESAGRLDAFLVKYDPNGNVVWTRQFGGSDVDAAFGIDADATNIYVVGITCSQLGTIPGAQNGQAFVAKFDLDGNLVWTYQFYSFEVYGIAVHSGVYVTGTGFVLKLDPDGRRVWTRSFETWGRGIAVDATGIYVAGYNATSQGRYALVEKYDARGNVLWTQRFGTSGDDAAFAVAVDATGVYAAGSTNGTFPNQVAAGGFDAFVRRYGLDGEEGWTVQFGSSDSDGALDVDVGSLGLYVAGFAFGTLPGQTSAGGEDAFVAKFRALHVDLPPLVRVPGPIIAEAAGPSGAKVDYPVTAEDDVDGSVIPVCSPASGTVFPLGTTTVTCTARDSAGNEATATFTVEVRDSGPPDIIFPADFQVGATGPSGAAVTFDVTATDLVDPAPAVSCSPFSGSTFGIGTTTVTCTATDFAGNAATASFRVTVTEERIRPSGFDFVSVEVAAIVVALVAAIAAVVTLIRRKRKGRDPKHEGDGAS